MKILTLSSLLAGLAVLVLMMLFNGRSPDSVVESSAGDLKELEGRIDALSELLERLSLDVRNMKGLASFGAAVSRSPREAADPAEAAVPSAAEAGGDELTALVAELVDAALTRREQNHQRDLAEVEELSKGPYGLHNYQVNAMAQKLSLSEDQTAYYYDLVLEQQKSMGNLLKDVPWDSVDPENFQAAFDEALVLQQDVRDALNENFLATLTPEQQEIYGKLPSAERFSGDSENQPLVGG